MELVWRGPGSGERGQAVFAGGAWRLETGFNDVSGKPHRKMPEGVSLLKSFRLCCDVSGNLMIRARCEVCATHLFQFRIRMSGESAAAGRGTRRPGVPRVYDHGDWPIPGSSWDVS